MGNFVRQYDKEYMKMAMLKHEETFREQVGELHRLYTIQKMLMRDMKGDAVKRQQMPRQYQSGGLDKSGAVGKRLPRQASHRRALDLERPAEDYAHDDDDDNDGDGDGDVEPESEIELTLATGAARRRRRKEEASVTSDSAATSFSSTESGGENSRGHEWGLLRSEFNGGGAARDERMEHPPWLLQCLSLNFT